MYRSCIFCSASLGSNAALETFPVGRQIAFDGWRGRLWVVCPACRRWNLSPIEERWEAVEAAEKLFRDARLRVQSENVGLAQLPDNTRLIRIGNAVPGELAAWRYGRQLRQRRKRHFLAGGAGLIGTAAFYGGLSAMGLGLFSFMVGVACIEQRQAQKILYRSGSPGPDQIIVRRWHLDGMDLRSDGGDGVAVHVRDAHRTKGGGISGEVNRTSKDVAEIVGDDARALLKRVMVHVNKSGATDGGLKDANLLLTRAGSADALIAQAAQRGKALGSRAGRKPELLIGPMALAFEMALNDASERRAMEGDLVALEAAWREAEEIAAIADALPGEATLNRLLDRLAH